MRTLTLGPWGRRLVVAGALMSSSARAAPAAPEDLEPPVLLNAVDVVYPDTLLDQQDPPAGVVRIRFRIDIHGIAQDITVLDGVDPQIDELVVEAIQALRYEPAQYHGEAVEIVTTLAIDVQPPVESKATGSSDDESTDVDSSENDGAADPDELRVDPPSHNEEGGPMGRLKGQLVQAGQRTPIADAVVLVGPPEGSPESWMRRVTTDEQGRFELEDIPVGALTVVVVAPGFERQQFAERIEAEQELRVRYFAAPEANSSYRTVVENRGNPREELGRRSLSKQEIQTLPGNQGDALRSVQSLPGVARPPYGAGLLIVRGSSPFDTAVVVGEHTVTFLFHFGALSTAIPTELIDGIEFIPGNFDARYGNHIGGVVRVRPRAGRRDGWHGHAELALLHGGAHLEGPIGRGSIIVAARRSIVDLALPALLPDDANLQFTQAPRYYDYQASVDYPIGPVKLTLRGLGGDDQAVFVQPDANEFDADSRDRRGTELRFHRVDFELRAQERRWSFLVTPSYRYERAEVVNSEFFSFDIARHNLSFRAELGARISRKVALTVGTESIASWANIRGDAPSDYDFATLEPTSPGERTIAESREYRGFSAIYATTTLGVGTRLRVIPGVRATYYGRPQHRWAVDPRLRVAWDLRDTTVLRAGVGLYSQEPAITQQSSVFGNPDLGPERSLHTGIELEQTFASSWTWTLSGFYKYQFNRVAVSNAQQWTEDGGVASERQSNEQDGHIYGAEVLLRKDPDRIPVLGWLSYTLLWSRLRDRPGEPHYDADFAQRHVLNAVVGVQLPKRWRVGGRFQLTSGAPYTPVNGALLDAASGAYIPIDGPRNAETLPLFHQLSLRVEKTWLGKWASATAYLDLQNVYNASPTESYVYSYDYRERASVGGLPIVPWVGLRVDW